MVKYNVFLDKTFVAFLIPLNSEVMLCGGNARVGCQ